ncbi:MAG TPA: DUF1508 domain-containing protein [Solibacterales bacterium]|nr:DUF1508 domain-containing protein [Bryobacterales bacterium]
MYFTLYKDNRAEWRWKCRSSNHEDICVGSKEYAFKQGALHGIALFKQGATAARIYDDATKTWS